MKYMFAIFILVGCDDLYSVKHTESTGACYIVLESTCLGGEYMQCRVDIKKQTTGIQFPLKKNFESMRITVHFLTIKDDIICRKHDIARRSNGSILYEGDYWDLKNTEQAL